MSKKRGKAKGRWKETVRERRITIQVAFTRHVFRRRRRQDPIRNKRGCGEADEKVEAQGRNVRKNALSKKGRLRRITEKRVLYRHGGGYYVEKRLKWSMKLSGKKKKREKWDKEKRNHRVPRLSHGWVHWKEQSTNGPQKSFPGHKGKCAEKTRGKVCHPRAENTQEVDLAAEHGRRVP